MSKAEADGSPANAVRGEVSIELGSPAREFVLRPSFAAVQAIEARTGKGMVRLAEDCRAGNLTLADTATIVTEMIRAQGQAAGDSMLAAVHPDRIAEMIHETAGGLAATQGKVNVVLFWAVTGGYRATGELKPAEEIAAIVAMLNPPEPDGQATTTAA